MKPSRFERMSDSLFTGLNVDDRARLIGGAGTIITRISGPFTAPPPGGPPDVIRLDMIPDA
jgi:hypothetical protein